MHALNDAVSAFCHALELYTREQMPQYWAGTENNLGNAHLELAERSDGTAGLQALNDAVSAFRARSKSSLKPKAHIIGWWQLVATRNIARAYEQQGDWTKAREAYQQLLRHDPQNESYRGKVEELAQKAIELLLGGRKRVVDNR